MANILWQRVTIFLLAIAATLAWDTDSSNVTDADIESPRLVQSPDGHNSDDNPVDGELSDERPRHGAHKKCAGRFPPFIWNTRTSTQRCGLDVSNSCPCRNPRYREISGACNNPSIIGLGAAGTPYNRVLAPRYADGVDKVIDETSSRSIPSVRVLSFTLFKDKDRPDPYYTMLLMQVGQMIAIDTSFLRDMTQSDGSRYQCCRGSSMHSEDTSEEHSASSSSQSSGSSSEDQGSSSEEGGRRYSSEEGNPSACLPIALPSDDPFYSAFDRRCMEFVRSVSVRCPPQTKWDVGHGRIDASWSQWDNSTAEERMWPKRTTKPRTGSQANQINFATSFIDASFLYANDDAHARLVRAGRRGLLKSRWVPVRASSTEEGPHGEGPHSGSEERGSSSQEGDTLEEFPPTTQLPNPACDPSAQRCYLTGDSRVNFQPQTISIYIIFLREHNRIARRLHELNPHWTDEQLFQEARRIVISEWQRIIYRDYLPIFIEKKMINRMKLRLDEDHRGDYDSSVNPSTMSELLVGIGPLLSTWTQGSIELYGEGRCPERSLRLRDHFLNPSVVEDGDSLLSIIRGMTHQPQQQPDLFITEELTRYYLKLGREYGDDIVSISIQRARDHGIPSYNDMRRECGLSKATSFDDFGDVMDEKGVKILKKFYRSVDDVDLLVGAILEELCSGGEGAVPLLGPTVSCLVAEQFYRWRKGDRYFFANKDGPGALTEAQYKAILKVDFNSILCDNFQGLEYLQKNPFMRVSENNELRKCSHNPGLDLGPWTDHRPGGNCPSKSCPAQPN